MYLLLKIDCLVKYKKYYFLFIFIEIYKLETYSYILARNYYICSIKYTDYYF